MKSLFSFHIMAFVWKGQFRPSYHQRPDLKRHNLSDTNGKVSRIWAGLGTYCHGQSLISQTHLICQEKKCIVCITKESLCGRREDRV